ncbi:hypothetical protein FB446DRAFT_795882 [Lentinula raphanica]|nr:hypothetical protein FB446DRAFT_795882 [Lentinula raphanica]
MSQTESDLVFLEDSLLVDDFVLVNNPSAGKTRVRPWEPNLSVERFPLQDSHFPALSNAIAPLMHVHGDDADAELCDDADSELYDDADSELCDNLSEESDWEPPPSEAVVFCSTLAYMSGYMVTDDATESYHCMPVKVVVAQFSPNSIWILVGSLHSTIPIAVVPMRHCHLDPVLLECKIERQILLVHDLSSVVEHVRTHLTIRFMSNEFSPLCHALNSSPLHTPSTIPDWFTWLSVMHEYKKLGGVPL